MEASSISPEHQRLVRTGFCSASRLLAAVLLHDQADLWRLRSLTRTARREQALLHPGKGKEADLALCFNQHIEAYSH
ncbi:hypothetical protein ECP03023083_5109 [Escherichia coli P0302308.3]|nr:hypothetical protein ECP03023083_5109 [Escherichia coli P0302308.3]